MLLDANTLKFRSLLVFCDMLLRLPGTRYTNSRLIVLIIIALLAFLSIYLVLKKDMINLHPFKLTDLTERKQFGRQRLYFDFSGNNISECLIPKKATNEDVIDFYDERGLIIDVIRSGGLFLNNEPSFIVGDTDGDSFAELFSFYQRNDSILVSGDELMGDDRQFLKDFVIETGIFYDCENDLEFNNAQFYDLDGDGTDELVFAIRAGYSLYPRKIYVLYPREKKLVKSSHSAAGIRTIYLNRQPDHKEALMVVGCNAIENYDKNDPLPYNDYSGWLILYGKDLKKPVFSREFPENKTIVQAILRNTQKGLKIFCIINEQRSENCYLQRMDLEGNVEKSIMLPEGTNYYLMLNYFSPHLQRICVSVSDDVYRYSTDLEPLKTLEDIGIPISLNYIHLLNFTKESGFFLFGNLEKLFVRDQQMKMVGRTKLSEFKGTRGYRISVKEFSGYDHCTLTLTKENEMYEVQIRPNILYKVRYLLVILLFTGFFFVYYALFRIQFYFYNRRFLTQRKIAALQLQTIQNQLQPHFTFNVLNAIGSMIYTNRKEEAYEYLGYFSDMLRSALLLRNEVNWQIGEELSFISSYISMENLRYENKFEYKQQILGEVDIRTLVPKLSVQSFVENAIRHGLVNKKGECLLEVILSESEDHIQVVVKDNGIGRKNAQSYLRTQSGVGNMILQDYIKYYNRTHKIKFSLEIIDLLSEQGNPAGTLIVYKVPKDIKPIDSNI